MHTRYVVVDDRDVGRKATAHLLEMGHALVAHIAGPRFAETAEGRLEGYKMALAERGARFDRAYVVAGDYGEESGRHAAAQLLSLSPRPAAIFAANDLMAIGALFAIRDHGLRVPDDIAIAGCNDIHPARYTVPSLTTVRFPMYEMGAAAARTLVQSVRGEPVRPAKAVLPTRLIVRQSCGSLETDRPIRRTRELAPGRAPIGADHSSVTEGEPGLSSGTSPAMCEEGRGHHSNR
jgi:LacI family transcriptional regulator